MQAPGKNHPVTHRLMAALLSGALLLTSGGLLTGCSKKQAVTTTTIPLTEEVTALPRPALVDFSAGSSSAVVPTVPGYTLSPDLSNVTNLQQFYLSDPEKAALAQNQFLVKPGPYHEFFEKYEMNRYDLIPNFVTVDAMMHTYHLYFSLLLNRTEKVYLSNSLSSLSQSMLSLSESQYDALKGTEWEQAAVNNAAFFAVAASLQDNSIKVPEYAAAIVSDTLQRIYAADGIGPAPFSGDHMMDYTQFKPRGYYAGDEQMEGYFRAMMWYGQVNFFQSDDTLNRSALLMTLALNDKNVLGVWEMLYAVTSFFAGASDDLGYYEYLPAIKAAYGGELPDTKRLTEDSRAYEIFKEIISEMDRPAINSIPVWEGTENIPEITRGFRFMGQRFTIDAAIMQKLVYSNVKENGDGEKRMLPDVLDVPAAMGSQMAYALLKEQGDAAYQGYTETMESLQKTVQNASVASKTSNLYSSWLYTLSPLLQTKSEGCPAFMTSEAWQKKNLETYAGSFTELKHDTVLYAKQVMAEMGGGPLEDWDDRGYVEPEPEVFRRFALLAQQTAQGLQSYELIGEADAQNLSRLSQLAGMLQTIAEKELRNEPRTEEEYELIRTFGGTLEHFWIEAVKDRAGDAEYLSSQEIPASLVTDIATDPNGVVLQIANGRPAEILVVIPMDGELHLASGVVYDFYQFTQPMENRLTNSEWRQMIGEWADSSGHYSGAQPPEKPWWTADYWVREQ